MYHGPVGEELFARAALPAYGCDSDGDLRLLSFSENATFCHRPRDDRSGDTALVLRVHRPGYHSAVAIRSELCWMRALADDTGIATPEVIATTAGAPLVSIDLGGQTRHVDAFALVDGRTAEELPGEMEFGELGRVTARMHQHARSWEPPRWFTRFRWDLTTTLGADKRWGDWRDAPGMTTGLRSIIERADTEVSARLRDFGDAPDRFGLVHADLRLANLMVGPQRSLTVIDFDDCGWSWYLADLATVISWIETGPDAERIVAEWLTGYQEIAPMSADDLAMVPTFIMLRRLMLTAWIGTHPESGAALEVGDGFVGGTAQVAERFLDHSLAATVSPPGPAVMR
ncbi:phosphotransferase enzyme family protein [Williamsia sterculiae]|nr:phosphotransferase [Williamsia sterculiae]